ncbi:HNH endonuclease [Sphingomonas kyeonggiensis]|uniref:HNH nuclease domain-containing protein n=1 Tax=Sphingomonas kyeonggiensis TaxID=1268553 RepID=A0A7W6JS45_9SPHN|nr:HNH endonuclease [Sphingomonas kyeonggiensis]MBB4097486.1 hypothetical protein [Sphingomonas kyeonggiensis]
MPLFIAKPILWNRNGYRTPSGVRAYSGFPKKNGFGHEEWNASPALAFSEDGVNQRVFHTEGVGSAPVAENAGRVFVFMYASHDRVQELVGVAGNATAMMEDSDKPERIRLVEKLGLDRFSADAWAVSLVRERFEEDRRAFDRAWQTDLAWIPNWRCPAETFLWLDQPAPLDPQALRGKEKLLTMFGGHTLINEARGLQMMDFVPTGQRSMAWHRIRAEIAGPDSDGLASDLSKLANRKATVRKRLIDARLGQGGFRAAVAARWDERCAVSRCTQSAVLRASHIKAWSDSDDAERLDPANGLFLTADLDALFDRGLISFDDAGAMIVSGQLSKQDRRLFALPRPLSKPPGAAQRRYLAQHRRRWALSQ